MRTGKPIVYTSGDSVFQIAAHEEVIPIAELYRMCEIARKLAGWQAPRRPRDRPAVCGNPGNFARTSRRHDYAVDPPKPMLLDVLQERHVPVFGIGKIHDIYNGRGVDEYVTTKSNADGMEKLAEAARSREHGLIFCNFVDFDMLYGHRKDVEGFARSLEEFDAGAYSVPPALESAGPIDSHCRSRVRPGSAVGNHRPFPRVRADPGYSSLAKSGQKSRRARHPRRHGSDHSRKFWRQPSPTALASLAAELPR